MIHQCQHVFAASLLGALILACGPWVQTCWAVRESDPPRDTPGGWLNWVVLVVMVVAVCAIVFKNAKRTHQT